MKKTITLIIITALLLALASPAMAASVADFSDLSADSWCYNYVSAVVNLGLFNGTSSTTFSPDETMTRAMFVTVLGRYGEIDTSKYVVVSDDENAGVVTANDVRVRNLPTTTDSEVLATVNAGQKVTILGSEADASGGSLPWYHVSFDSIDGYIRSDLMKESKAAFTDVDPSAWYAPYVMWAYSNGIAAGTSETTFSPDRNITREEICSMLYNFGAVKKYIFSGTVDAKTFSDAGSITAAYRDAVSTMQKLAVVTGYADGSFKPKNSATRAEVSAMLVRYIDATGYHPVEESSYDSNGNYIFGTAVPDTGKVAESYYADACFIGHSLMVGFDMFTDTGEADFFAKESASVRTLMSYDGWELTSTHTDEAGVEVHDTGNLAEALSQQHYGKVYIMMGANECSATEGARTNFYNNMCSLVDTVRQSQPNARVYIISMTPVYKAYSEKAYSLCRDNILIYNDILKRVCRDKACCYLDVFNLLCDSDGFLPDGLSTDGLHLKNASYDNMFDYFLSHTMK